jgi:DNA-binding NarL/FixJ family response regulator
LKRSRVLLADSHLNMLGGGYTLLSIAFDTVMMVADEASLLDAAATFKPELVVVDLSLPHAGEANIVKRLVEHSPDLRFIVLSVHDELALVSQLLHAGAAGFVLKRAAATDLLPAVAEVLRGGVYVSPALKAHLPESATKNQPG